MCVCVCGSFPLSSPLICPCFLLIIFSDCHYYLYYVCFLCLPYLGISGLLLLDERFLFPIMGCKSYKVYFYVKCISWRIILEDINTIWWSQSGTIAVVVHYLLLSFSSDSICSEVRVGINCQMKVSVTPEPIKLFGEIWVRADTVKVFSTWAVE